jgi:hypothetical protein
VRRATRIWAIVFELIMNNAPWYMYRSRVFPTHTVKTNLVFEEHNSSRVVPGLVWSEWKILDPRLAMWDLTVWSSWISWLSQVWRSVQGLKELAQYWSQVQTAFWNTHCRLCGGGQRHATPWFLYRAPARPAVPLTPWKKRSGMCVVCE